MKSFGEKISFVSPLNVETSYSTKSLGSKVKSTMEIFVEENQHNLKPKHIQSCTIEWCYFVGEDREDATHIGCWFENGFLVDYDGVFELPRQAVRILRKNGFSVPKDYIQ
jgi:hypothetical protein